MKTLLATSALLPLASLAVDYKHSQLFTVGGTPGTPITVSWTFSGAEILLGVNIPTNAADIQGGNGWVAVGIGEETSGSMRGADIVAVTKEGADFVATDHFALDFALPEKDSQQDWVFDSASSVGDGTDTYNLRRAVDTNDSQDRVISSGPTRFLLAFGDGSPTMTYHGANRYMVEIDLSGSSLDSLASVKNNPDVMSFDLKTDYTVTGEATVYWDIYKTLADVGISNGCFDPSSDDLSAGSGGAITSCAQLKSTAAERAPTVPDPCDVTLEQLGVTGNTETIGMICPATCLQCPEGVTPNSETFYHIIAFEHLTQANLDYQYHHFTADAYYASGERFTM